MMTRIEERQTSWLTFTVNRHARPAAHEILREFYRQFTVRYASNFTDSMGIIAMEFAGPGETIEKAVRWLEKRGVVINSGNNT